TPWIGWAVGRVGRGPIMVGVVAGWPSRNSPPPGAGPPARLCRPALGGGCGVICQAVSTGYVTVTAKAGRSSAVGLYVTGFYLGGSFGAAVGAIAWTLGGGPPCVALVAAMLVIMAAIVIFAWSETARQEKPSPIEPP